MYEFLNRFLGAIIGLAAGCFYAVFYIAICAIGIGLIAASFTLNLISILITLTGNLLLTLLNPLTLIINGPVILFDTAVTIIKHVGAAVMGITFLLLTAAVFSIAYPLICFLKGITEGIKQAIVDPIARRPAEQAANAPAQGVLNLAPNIHDLLNKHVPNSISINKKRDLIEKINALSLSSRHEGLRLDEATLAKLRGLPAGHPVKGLLSRYEAINQENVCSITASNLLDIQEPLTVEYTLNGITHYKTYEASRLLPWLSRDTNRTARLPEQIDLIDSSRSWEQPEGRNFLLSTNEMKIYKGISTQHRDELIKITQQIRAAVNEPWANVNAVFNMPSPRPQAFQGQNTSGATIAPAVPEPLGLASMTSWS